MDQESRDANQLLMELDHGLVSSNIGEQSEAVARFTTLFQQYPLPILINSACLKLSEAFRFGSNFLRIQICEVFEHNQSHLKKIYSVEDFFRNIFTVTTSNDPIARSITLLALGNIAPLVSSHKSIHHYISSSLETSTDCELSATITCAACYVKCSSEFACNIYPKIVSIVDSDETSNDVKIRALSVLDHGFYNADDALTVRSFLIDVMEKSKMRKLTYTCLTLSTKIAFTSLSHILPQINLLLRTFLQEDRLSIKLISLSNLGFLAEKSPHIWETKHVDPLISYLESGSEKSAPDRDNNIIGAILSIFCKLLRCKCNFVSDIDKSRIFRQCFKLALNNQNITLCSMAFELLTVMSKEQLYTPNTNKTDNQQNDFVTDTFEAIRTFIINVSTTPKASKRKSDMQQADLNSPGYKPVFRNIVKLSDINPTFRKDLLNLIFERITCSDVSLNELSPHLTELLCAIIQSTSKPVISPDSCWTLIKTRSHEMSETSLSNLCVLYFQLLRLESDQHPCKELVDITLTDHSFWFGFRVMRQAMRYGHHGFAKLMCEELHEYVTTDTSDFYFKSIHRICSAESILVQEGDMDTNLNQAIPLYEDALSPLRTSIGNSRTTNFQSQFLWLRIRCLQAHSALRQCCRIYSSSPISYSTLLSAIGANRSCADPSLAKISIIYQMLKVAKEFRQLGESYDNLSVVSFNCDIRTLEYVSLLRTSCIIMADIIDAIFQYGKNLPVISKILMDRCDKEELALEHQEFHDVCLRLIEMTRTEVVKPGLISSSKTIEPHITLLKTFSLEIQKCPFVYPRYFFQQTQTTQIKLAISPPPETNSGSISTLLNRNLVLKVEGLVQSPTKPNLVIRKVSKVSIALTMNPSKPSDVNCNMYVQSTATPYNEYFKTEFLLPMKWPGQFTIVIDVSIIDEQERVWRTGPTERVNVSVS